jgi:hypothetical protein
MGTDLRVFDLEQYVRCAQGAGVPEMSQARSYYDLEYDRGLTWWFTGDEFGHALRERYQVPKELPLKLLALVRKLEAVESNRLPSPRTLIGKLDVIEGKYLSCYAPPIEPRSVGPNDDWFLCT